jgi:hypothetical protein
MRLEAVELVQAATYAKRNFDLAIAASGYESRATYGTQQFRFAGRTTKVALAFTDRLILHRRQNDRAFEQRGFKIMPSDGDNDDAIKSLLSAVITQREGATQSATIRVWLDYTSMTRVWYAGALDFLRRVSAPAIERLELFLTYSPSQFAEPHAPTPNAHMGPIQGFSHLGLPNRRTALVVGLGYEAQRSLGLVEYLEPNLTYALLADPSVTPEFLRAATRNNRALLKRLPVDQVIRYDIADLQTTVSQLTSLTIGLNKDYRVILAPLGPKPFTLACLLVASRFPLMDVWRVSSGAGGHAYDRPPDGRVFMCKATFVPDRTHIR